MTTYYTRTGGSDAHPCSSVNDDAHAKQSITAGVGCLSGGDTLSIADGTYTELAIIDAVPSGSAGNPTTIKAENNRLAVYNQVGATTGFGFNAAHSWIVFDGLKFTGGSNSIFTSGAALNTFHDITIQNCEFASMTHGNPLSFTGCARCNTLNNYFHDIGDPSDSLAFGCAAHGLCPAVYYSDYSMNGTISGNTFTNITEYGIQIVVDIATYPDSFVLSGNTFNHIGWGGGGSTAVGSGPFIEGTNNLIYNNLVYDTGFESLIVNAVGSAGMVKIMNNTLYGGHPNGGAAGINNVTGSGADCFNNLIIGYTGTAVSGCDSETNDIKTGTASAIFITPGSDFHLKAGSAAIAAGTNLSATFTADISGNTRTVPWDVGAYKYITAAASIITKVMSYARRRRH